MSQQWVPFQEGEYLGESACIVGEDGSVIDLDHPILEVRSGPDGIRTVHGRALGRPMDLVAMLDDNDRLDMAISMGSGFAFRMTGPEIQAGKVFAPEVLSTIQFTPIEPWSPISDAEYRRIRRL